MTAPLHTLDASGGPLGASPSVPQVESASPPVAGGVHRRGRRRMGIVFWVSVTWFALVVFGAVFASVLPIPSPTALDPFHRLLPIGSSGHLLGTDDLGRDVLSRVIFGARVSLIVGAVSLASGLIIGGTLGMVAGFVGGWLERLITWLMDVLLSFPALVFLIALVAYVGQSLFDISLALGFLSIPVFARLGRATTLATAERDFVKAARGAGLSAVADPAARDFPQRVSRTGRLRPDRHGRHHRHRRLAQLPRAQRVGPHTVVGWAYRRRRQLLAKQSGPGAHPVRRPVPHRPRPEPGRRRAPAGERRGTGGRCGDRAQSTTQRDGPKSANRCCPSRT